MTELICTFVVPGYCQPKQRTFGNRFVTPSETRAYEKLVGTVAKVAMKGKPPFRGFIGVNIEIICAPPASWSKKKKAWAMEGKLFPTHADLDNSCKCVLDGMNRIVYDDDRFINWLGVRREYGPEEKATVTVNGM